MKSLKALTLVTVLVCAVPAFGAFDAFLKIGDIKGESTDQGHKDWIEVSSFSWGSPGRPAVANVQGCATNEITFSVAGKAAPLLAQKCQRNERLQEVTIDYMNTHHVLQGAVIRSCSNNLFTIHFDRCAIHPAAKPVAAAVMVQPAVNTQPNGRLSFGTEGPEEINLLTVQPQGANAVVLKQRGASSSLMLHCVAGKHYDKVTLTSRKAGGKQQEYMTFTMHDVIITSYQTAGDGSLLVGLKFANAEGSLASFQDVH